MQHNSSYWSVMPKNNNDSENHAWTGSQNQWQHENEHKQMALYQAQSVQMYTAQQNNRQISTQLNNNIINQGKLNPNANSFNMNNLCNLEKKSPTSSQSLNASYFNLPSEDIDSVENGLSLSSVTMEIPESSMFTRGVFTPDDHSIQKTDLINRLRVQLEYYFRRENLSTDTYLISQMDSDTYVLISTIAKFNQIRKLTNDISLVIEAIKKSPDLQLDDKCERVRAAQKRCVLILRDIPSQTPPSKVCELFESENCPKFISCQHEHNDNWYVMFQSEDNAREAYQYLRENVQTFMGKPLMARIKAKPTITPKSLYLKKNNQQLSNNSTAIGVQQHKSNNPIKSQYSQQMSSHLNLDTPMEISSPPILNISQGQYFQPPMPILPTNQTGMFMPPFVAYQQQQLASVAASQNNGQPQIQFFSPASQANSFLPFFPYQPDANTAFLHGFSISRQIANQQITSANSNNSSIQYQSHKNFTSRNNANSSNRNSTLPANNRATALSRNTFNSYSDVNHQQVKRDSNGYFNSSQNNKIGNPDSMSVTQVQLPSNRQVNVSNRYRSVNSLAGKTKNRQKDDNSDVIINKKNQSNASNQKYVKDVNFQLESNSFPPLPGLNGRVVECQSSSSSEKMSDVVKGGTKVSMETELHGCEKINNNENISDTSFILSHCKQDIENATPILNVDLQKNDMQSPPSSMLPKNEGIFNHINVNDLTNKLNLVNMSYAQVAQVSSSQDKHDSMSSSEQEFITSNIPPPEKEITCCDSYTPTKVMELNNISQDNCNHQNTNNYTKNKNNRGGHRKKSYSNVNYYQKSNNTQQSSK